jgi:hypothetical protein
MKRLSLTLGFVLLAALPDRAIAANDFAGSRIVALGDSLDTVLEGVRGKRTRRRLRPSAPAAPGPANRRRPVRGLLREGLVAFDDPTFSWRCVVGDQFVPAWYSRRREGGNTPPAAGDRERTETRAHLEAEFADARAHIASGGPHPGVPARTTMAGRRPLTEAEKAANAQ